MIVIVSLLLYIIWDIADVIYNGALNVLHGTFYTAWSINLTNTLTVTIRIGMEDDYYSLLNLDRKVR